MKNTYTRTLFISDLREAEVTLYITEKTKYEVTELDEETKQTYTGLTSWDLIEGGEEAKELENETDGTCIDENHEYLVLHFEDGSQATFRNSHVSMFIR